MKLSNYLLVVFLIALVSCSNEKQFTCNLTGEVPDKENATLFFYKDGGSIGDTDTIPVVNGKFSTTVSLKQPEVYVLAFERDKKTGERSTPVKLFMEPGNVNITIPYNDVSGYKVQGGQYNEMLYQSQSAIHKVVKLINNLESKYREFVKENDTAGVKIILREADSMINEIQKIQKDRITKYSDLVSSYYLWDMSEILEPGEIKTLLEPLAAKFPESRYIIETSAFIDGIDKNKVSQTMKYYQLADTNLKKVNLQNEIENGKITLVAFWSSRCNHSDWQLREYKKIYDNYNSKGFDIVGIVDDCDMTRWKDAIERNKSTWQNLIDIDGEQAVEKYFNAYTDGDILVDSTGVILARIKSPDELQVKLNELLN